METFEIYCEEKHLGSLYIENNRYRLEALASGDYGFDLKDTDWTKPIPFFERILARYNDKPYEVVFEDDESAIILYKVDQESRYETSYN